MNYLRLLFAIPLVAMISCGDDDRSQHANDSTIDSAVVVDSIVPADTLPASIIASGMGGDTIAPPDNALIFYSFTKTLSENKHKALSVKEVRARFMPLDTACDGEAAWTFQRFFFLDSLKKRGEQPETDMGQTVKVEIREYDTIKRSPAETWIVWTMWYETSQSCPYATGTYYMLSTYNANGKLVSTQCMGRDVGGADAPLTWSTVQTCNIFTDGSFRGLLCDTVGDYEDDGRITYSSIMRKTFTGVIASGGKITSTAKEIERNE